MLSLALAAGLTLLAPTWAKADVGGTGIAGHVYNDANGNGVLDAGETPLAGVQVNLYDTANTLVASAYTGPGGDHSYTFGNLTPGTYTVKLATIPTGYTATNAIPGMEASGFVFVNTNPVGAKVSNTAIQIPALTEGDSYTPNDFLITQQAPPPPPPPVVQPVNICGVVYRDINCNGSLQTGEPGLSNVCLQLVDSSGNVVDTTATDINGSYCFMNEPVGMYVVREIVPIGLSADNALPGTGGMFLSSASLKVTATTGGTNYVNENFLLCMANGGAFTTFTQGGYGAKPHGNNPGALLQKNFATVYPNGLTVGIGNTLFFRSAPDAANFLPQGGTPGTLANRYVNPTGRTEAGVFAGQVVTLQLSVDLSQASVTRIGLADLQVVSGPLAGYTVAQALLLANTVLGGNLNALPSGVSVSTLNDVVTAINENFDGGTINKGYLR